MCVGRNQWGQDHSRSRFQGAVGAGRGDPLRLGEGVGAPELAETHGISIQRVYNLKSENRGRFQQIVQAEKETLQVLKHETFNDLWIMQESARMAGFAEIGQVALRKFLELNAASYVYDPGTGQAVATRMSRADAANMKMFADMYRDAVRDAMELSGQRPGTLDKRHNQSVMKRHQDPPSAEELEAAAIAQEWRDIEYQQDLSTRRGSHGISALSEAKARCC